jgi:hypothetical protein
MNEGGKTELKNLMDGAQDFTSCQIKPLGANNGAYFFMSGMGEIRRFRPNDMNEAGFQSLFDGDWDLPACVAGEGDACPVTILCANL